MTQPTAGPCVALVAGRDDVRTPAAQALLEAQPADTLLRFAPADLQALDRAVIGGRVRRVLFTDPADLLRGVWDEEITLEQWPADVSVEFPGSPDDPTTLLRAAGAWRQWRRAHRRRQALAGAVLSALVLAVSFLLTTTWAR